MKDAISVLRECHIQPTPQRIAVVDYVLNTRAHPSADEVLEHARKKCPTVSRATVYNTLNLMVKKGLLKTQLLKEGTVFFDPNMGKHHHFIDNETGDIYDIPWDHLQITEKERLKGFEISEYQVIMRGRRKKK
ncbi:MAG: transcriptional repressor [Candidatus Zixiibacteriota bacterium]|nr:MAG: transcriptional repressor [candidate division Zixibacteria bacterium]